MRPEEWFCGGGGGQKSNWNRIFTPPARFFDGERSESRFHAADVRFLRVKSRFMFLPASPAPAQAGEEGGNGGVALRRPPPRERRAAGRVAGPGFTSKNTPLSATKPAVPYARFDLEAQGSVVPRAGPCRSTRRRRRRRSRRTRPAAPPRIPNAFRAGEAGRRCRAWRRPGGAGPDHRAQDVNCGGAPPGCRGCPDDQSVEEFLVDEFHRPVCGGHHQAQSPRPNVPGGRIEHGSPR